MNWVTGSLAIASGLVIVWAGTAFGLVFVAFGVVVLFLRRTGVAIEPTEVVLRGSLFTRRFAWDEVSAVRVQRRLVGFRRLQVVTADGQPHAVDGVGTWRAQPPTKIHDFATAASLRARAAPPTPPPPIFVALRQRSGFVFWGIIAVGIVLIVLVLLSVA